MKRLILGLVAAAIWAAHAGPVLASTAREAQPVIKQSATLTRSSVAHSEVFAAASVPFVKRLTPEQREEWHFLKDAMAASHFENEAARIALARSGDPNVRSLAVALVNHHASVQPALQRMLHARSMAPPMLSNAQRKSLNHLTKLQGVRFDREWTQAVALDSQQDMVLTYERAAPLVRDPALRSWIRRTLPTMLLHLASAQRIVTGGGTKFASLTPSATSSVIKSHAPPGATASAGFARRYMGVPPDPSNSADLGEGNMLLGPSLPVAVRVTEPNIR